MQRCDGISQNSDRISGEIEKLEGKHLSVKTAYAGVIEIDWTMVQGIIPTKSYSSRWKTEWF